MLFRRKVDSIGPDKIRMHEAASTSHRIALDLLLLKQISPKADSSKVSGIAVKMGRLLVAGISVLYLVSLPQCPPKLMKVDFTLGGEPRSIVLTEKEIKARQQEGNKFMYLADAAPPLTGDSAIRLGPVYLKDTSGVGEVKKSGIPIIADTVIPLSDFKPVDIWSSSQ